MALNNQIKDFKNKGRDIKYLNKDFVDFRENLIEFAKTYFPTTYNDFNESSPGMMFIEMASYIGDVLGYYIDDTLRESLLTTAQDRENIFELSKMMGYRPKVTSPATTKLSVFQLVPSRRLTNPVSSGDLAFEPDEDYYLRIKEGMELDADGVQFRTTDLLDFADSTDRETTIYERDGDTNNPKFYLVKKYVDVISAEEKKIEITFSATQSENAKIDIPDNNVIDIFDVRDANNNKYYKVPYLGQEMVYVEYSNTEGQDKDLFQFRDSVPQILKVIKTPRRFKAVTNPNGSTSIQFGSGDAGKNDELMIPTFKNVGLGLPNSIDKLGASFDPSNFLLTKSYGQSPKNTTMTVKYLVGGGVKSNVAANTIKRITKVEYDEDTSSFDQTAVNLYTTVKNSLAVDNDQPATGGRGAETLEEIRENAIANFGAQNRAVTAKDYQVRALSMPPKFGNITKAFVQADGRLDDNSPSSVLASPTALDEFSRIVQDIVSDGKVEDGEIKESITKFLSNKKQNIKEKNNPFAVNLYVLGYDSNKRLASLNRAVKENLKTYLSEHRMLTDGVNLLDGFVVNIGLDFDVRVYGDYNKREVLTNCITALKEYFEIDKWTFNMPINIGDVEMLIGNIEGVQSVVKTEFKNLCGTASGYSVNEYDVLAATKNKQIYPSLDPCVFEVKYPDKDIRGRVV
tara:strand:+ start:2323 stop:4374 length:2052 start_codon:yes stop_codon:yes gene_type:complete